MAKVPVLGNDPFLRGAAERPPAPAEKETPPAPPAAPGEASPPERKAKAAKKAKGKPAASARAEAKVPRAPAKKPVERAEEADPVPAPAQASDPSKDLGWIDRARELATGTASDTAQRVLSAPAAQRAIEKVMSSPVTQTVAGAATRATEFARTTLSSVLAGEAANEAGEAFRQATAHGGPEAGALDAFGEDPALLSRAERLFDFLHDRYFRVEALGAERLPRGASLLVCNHSGVLPLDGPMIRTVVRKGCGRTDGRWLVEDALFHAPFVGTLLNRLGAVRACPENADRLLEQGVPLAVFPEGLLGISKPVSQRYQLQRFGRGGFVKVALKARAPIVPVAIVGAEEASPLLAKIPFPSIGFPYLPVTPTFPLLGPFGLLPFPTKWTVSFLEPIPVERHPANAAEDAGLVAELTAKVRTAIQQELDRLVSCRRSILKG